MASERTPLDQVVDAWLTVQHSKLLNDLSATLDIQSGVTEAVQAEQFVNLAIGLGNVLAIDAGLSVTIGIPSTRGSSPDEFPDASLSRANGDSLCWLSQFAVDLALIGAPARLNLRTHPHYADARDSIHLALNLDAVRELDRALSLASDNARNRDQAHEYALAVARIARDRHVAGNIDAVNRALSQARARDHELACALDVACRLTLDLADRLTRDLDVARDLLRIHAEARTYAYTSDLTQAFDIALDLDLALADTRKRAHERARDLDLACKQAHARDFVRELARDHVRDGNLVGDIARAHSLVRDLKFSLVNAAGRSLDLDLARGRVLAVAQHLGIATSVEAPELLFLRDVLDQAATDFTGADLRSASLLNASLERVRWSATTRWPKDYEEQIREASVEIGFGIFEVRGGRLQRHNATTSR